MTVWVVTNRFTYPETAVIAVFSLQHEAESFAAKRNNKDEPVTFFVHKKLLDMWSTIVEPDSFVDATA